MIPSPPSFCPAEVAVAWFLVDRSTRSLGGYNKLVSVPMGRPGSPGRDRRALVVQAPPASPEPSAIGRAIVVSSWEMVKECLATNDAALATRPSMAVGKYIAHDHAAFANSPYGPYWRLMLESPQSCSRISSLTA
ncbi:hypothetical protein Droror1_Dr00010437 [Drosera rotundifolia]